jgi:signal transduction histidine kinase/CheY-like chemotaxis protein/HPt (histidine-containing phosphotransfer) domain-containing protein
MSHNGKRSGGSLALRCLALVGLLSVAASLPVIWMAWEADAARERAALIAQSAADQVQAGVREQVARFERATAGLRAQDIQGDTTLLTARLLRMEPIIAPALDLSVVSARGTQIASTLPSSSNVAAPGWLPRALAPSKTRDPIILSPDSGSDGQNWMLVRRVEDSQGATVGIVASSLPQHAFKAMTTPAGTNTAILAYSADHGSGSDQVRIGSEQAITAELSPLGLFQAWIPAGWLAPQSSGFASNNLRWTGTVDPAALLRMRADEINRHGRIAGGLAIALAAIGIMLILVPRLRIVLPTVSKEQTEPNGAAALVEVEAEALRQQLGELAQERDRVLAAIGHDVRTPINSILGICALLLDGDLDDGQRKWLQRMRASCEALLAMLNGMLEIAAARVDGAEVHNEAVDLASLIEEVGEVLRPQAHDKGLEIQVAIEETLLGTWSTDPTRLRQVLFNLAGNAVKYTMHGSIEIRALACTGQAGQEMLEIRVSDTGPGIAEDERELIFEQFRRGRDEVSRGQEGLGLGLALCREIAALLGGSLSVESTLSVGSVFTFKMPMDRVQGSRGAPLAGRTALVVGLSEGLRRRVASHLEGMGFDAETAGDGFMALGAAERAAYQHGALDLLVLDAALAGLPADVLLARLQANRSFERTKTVLVSNGSMASSMEGRADLVVSHPVEASDLDRAVGALFETSSPLHDVYPRAPVSPKQRILVVEDNRINQALFLDVLNRSKFSAFAASSGEEAVQAAERGGFDLILMDVQMPGIDGTEATRRIRAMDSQRRMPIIGLTAHSGAVMRKRCLDAGMDLVLHKPVDLSRLLLRIREMIKAAGPAEDARIEAGASEHEPTLDIADEYVEVLIAELGVERGRTCVTGFLADTASHIPTLLQQAEAEDWQALASLSHNLAGAAGTLGAAALGDALLMVEDFARLGDKARLASALKEVEAVWDRTRVTLRRRFDILAAKRSGSLKNAA